MRGHMSTRLLNVALFIFVLFSTVLASNAKAGLILGTIYTDTDGREWIYFGSFDTNDGDIWNDADGNSAYGDVVWNDADGNSIYGDIDANGDIVDANGDIVDVDADSVYGDYATPLNGLEAAADFFNDYTSEFAISVFAPNVDAEDVDSIIPSIIDIVAGAPVVNHTAWYVQYESFVTQDDEDATANAGEPGYSEIGDISAITNDRNDSQTNYVFKAVEVPEPSTLAIFSLALFALGARRFKKQ